MTQHQKIADLRQIVSEGLEITRKNLLDLSGRNRLLNFKHSGSKILRFVDEVPNQIYQELVDAADASAKGFLVSPVPLPKKSEYPDLFDSKDIKKLDVKAHARKLGINTEWELAAKAKSDQAKHQDDKLQTLHFPEELDRIVRRIQSEARTAIEESGVNMLFLCLGFLKWSDRDDSDVFYHAPLIMIPVEIERDKLDARTGFAKFRIGYTGEDVLDNICLREKLLQMAIELPSFDEFETPEKYFATLTKQLAEIKPDWEILRYATVGFLSFGKMLMYLDLAPEQWPGANGIAEDATHIYDIFAGNHSGNGTTAAEFDIDEDKKVAHIPQVMDADSSQHSAIIDVMNGRNLVIEGPPGTGKSQTITNLIAACLEQGKTVLFVAEKLAALEVVRKRLNSINLGDFCLELHSHKSQKKAVLADLKARLELNTNSYRSAANAAEERLQELNQKKSKLIQYAKAVNAEFGNTGQTPHQIFWKTEVLQKALKKPYRAEDFTTVSNTTQLSLGKIRSDLDCIRNLADNLRDYFADEHPNEEHYWNGIGLTGPIDYALQQDVFASLQKLSGEASHALAALEELERCGYTNYVFKKFPALAERLSLLKEEDFQFADLFEKLNIAHAHDAIEAAVTAYDTYKDSYQLHQDYLAELRISDQGLESLSSGIINSFNLPTDIPTKEVFAASHSLSAAIAAFNKTQDIFTEAATYLGLGKDISDLAVLQAICNAADFCSAVNKNDLAYRNAAIENAAENEMIGLIAEEHFQLQQLRAALAEQFNLESLPDIMRLKGIASTIQNTGLMSVLSSEWRKARNEYRTISKIDNIKTPQAATSNLERLIAYLEDTQKFAQNAAYSNLLPGIFRGIDTDIESLHKAIQHYQSLRAHCLEIPKYGTQLYQGMRSLEPHLYEWFARNHSPLKDGISSITAAIDIITPFAHYSAETMDIPSLMKSAAVLKDECERLEKILTDNGIPADTSLAQIAAALASSASSKSKESAFLSDSVVKIFEFDSSPARFSEQTGILSSLANTLEQVHEIVPPSMLSYILCRSGYQNAQACVDSLRKVISYQNALQKLSALIPVRDFSEFWHYAENKDKGQLEAVLTKLDHLEEHRESFDKWCEVINGFSEVKNNGLDAVIRSFTAAEEGKLVPFSDYASLYEYLVYHTLSHEALRQHRVLGSFSRVTHENLRASFKEIDLELQKLNAKRLARDISRRPIPEGNGGRSPKEFTDAHLIRHEIGKQKAHIPIRQLVNRSYDALVAMKPCFMMGPLSVAQYIPPHHEKFDVLIMDEASQVKPEDAIGVLARAKQVVVVGDSNQLPPTGFFDSLGADGNNDGDDGTTIQDSESILDVCKPLFQPLRRLRWHYRSQHQSLISFSNRHFYDSDLIIFPSPTANSEIAGVKHVHVPDGIYVSQSNPIEAKRVIEELMALVEKRPDLNYGVVTLNAKQKMIIEDEIERVRKDNLVFDSYMSEREHTDEELFVKNLENVQGDERDVIFISTTFGFDESGAFHQRFGPINGKDGWRRLNVLFTRAKQHVRIFSSFLPERITVDDSKEQRGRRALKDYLNFAITGIDSHSYETHEEPDSDFERAVGAFLKDQGYDVVYQLGVAGYRIDMVLRHPECATDYFIAIECDGAAYHSARTARDRDRLREENLRKLGWSHIHRIWSADWFKQRVKEEARLLQAVEDALNAKAIIAA